MSLSERIYQAQEGELPTVRPAAPIDGLADLMGKVQDQLFERLGTRLFETRDETQLHSMVVTEIGALLAETDTALSQQETHALIGDIARDVMGLGPVEQFLADPTVTEIMVNGSDYIYVERDGIIVRTRARFISEEHLRRVIDRIVSQVGRRVDEASPMVDARLLDGSRVNVIVPPLSLDGSILTIRKFAKDPFQVSDLVAMGTMSEQVAALLASAVEGASQHPRVRWHGQR